VRDQGVKSGMSHEFSFREQLSTMARERLEPSEIGAMIRLVSENRAISFTAGEPSADLFPLEELKAAFAGVFDDPSVLCYYRDDYGYIELREWIAGRMKMDGIAPGWVESENILLTNGGGEGIELVSEALIDPGSVVLVESPTFTESLLTFRKQGAHCLGVPSDEDGIIPEALAELLKSRKVRFLYTIPNFQNPSGRTSPLERRLKILELARSYDIPIFEDDPYHYLSYEGAPPSSYLMLAGEDKRVIHCSSFSKTLAPGLRAGWLVVPPSLLTELNAFRVSAGLGRPTVLQQGIHRLLENMDFSARVGFLQEAYRERRDGMVAALKRYLGGTGVTTNIPQGGFFIWGRAEHIADMPGFARYAVEHDKIGIIPGSAFYPPQEVDPSSFRISFAKVPPPLADEGVRRLANAFREYGSS
jgi:2-aminoadipate transaminase